MNRKIFNNALMTGTYNRIHKTNPTAFYSLKKECLPNGDIPVISAKMVVLLYLLSVMLEDPILDFPLYN